jgi:hypothetical protein
LILVFFGWLFWQSWLCSLVGYPGKETVISKLTQPPWDVLIALYADSLLWQLLLRMQSWRGCWQDVVVVSWRIAKMTRHHDSQGVSAASRAAACFIAAALQQLQCLGVASKFLTPWMLCTCLCPGTSVASTELYTIHRVVHDQRIRGG